MDELIKTVQEKVTDEVQKKAHDKLTELQAEVEKNLEESTSTVLPIEISSDNLNLKSDLATIQEQFSNFIQVAESTTEQIKSLGLETEELEQIRAKIADHKKEVMKASEFLEEKDRLETELKEAKLQADSQSEERQRLESELEKLKAELATLKESPAQKDQQPLGALKAEVQE